MTTEIPILVPNLPRAASHVPAGWRGLVEEAIAVLDRADPDWRLIQVKQKLGGLRIYYEQSEERDRTPQLGKQIARIESRSYQTCDICAAPATPVGDVYARRARCRQHRHDRGLDVPIVARKVAALDGRMAGVWLVETTGVNHVWDLDQMTYTRLPAPGNRAEWMRFDGNAMPVTQVGAWPTVGESFIVWFDDPEQPELGEHCRISTVVHAIRWHQLSGDRACDD